MAPILLTGSTGWPREYLPSSVFVLDLFAYASGNLRLADYLNIMYIPNLGELTIFIAAMIGACIGFLWYNTYPAQVFMGDTGSLALGGIIAALAVMVRKELLIPIFCGVFLVENLSVMIQVSYFKYTKKKYGEGRRVFLMSPLHHHYQKLGYHESKIAVRVLDRDTDVCGVCNTVIETEVTMINEITEKPMLRAAWAISEFGYRIHPLKNHFF